MTTKNWIAFFGILTFFFSCKKVTDLKPESNLNTATYYSSTEEVKAALVGCYNGLQRALLNEWQLTELRSDNSKQGVPGSTSSVNRDLSDMDMFQISPSHAANTTYWMNTYSNIRNTNIVLEKLGVVYDPATGSITLNAITIPITDADRKQFAGEAMFIRAYHYLNLVRLYGGVFLIHKSVSPLEAKSINRSSIDEVYKLIEADLKTAAANMNTLKYSQLTLAANVADLGRATGWAAKALLAKVYLTRNKKAEAITLLQDVRANSGYGLQANYANVFSVTSEMNNEILFAVRYKAPALGIGSPFANLFAPLSSGSNVVTGDGDGLNYPTNDLDTATNGDARKAVIVTIHNPTSTRQLYTKKYLPPQPSVNDDAENDWPVIRFSDVLLMLAEAQGYTSASLDLINSVRSRSGLPDYTMAIITSVAQFEQALSHERRVEFAFENQRWFDLVRYNTTFTTITAEQTIKDHFAKEYQSHYRLYVAPALTLTQLQANVTRDHLLLPIPQREIDTNTTLLIAQNPGY